MNIRLVPAPIQRTDRMSRPHDRMRNPRMQPGGITHHRLDDQSQAIRTQAWMSSQPARHGTRFSHGQQAPHSNRRQASAIPATRTAATWRRAETAGSESPPPPAAQIARRVSGPHQPIQRRAANNLKPISCEQPIEPAGGNCELLAHPIGPSVISVSSKPGGKGVHRHRPVTNQRHARARPL